MLPPVLLVIGLLCIGASALLNHREASLQDQRLLVERASVARLTVVDVERADRELAQAKLIVTLKDHLRAIVAAQVKMAP